MSPTLAACAVLRDDLPYLEEWLGFHRLVGVELFLLYHAGPPEPVRAVVERVLAPDQVRLIEHAGSRTEAYRHCLETQREACRWLAFLDLEDFLFSPGRDDIRPLLEGYAEHPAVAVNRILYGASGHEAPPPGLVTRSFTRRCHSGLAQQAPHRLRRPGLDPARPDSYYPLCADYRVIVQPRLTLACDGPNAFRFADDRPAVDERGGAVNAAWTEGVSVAQLRINHYWSRSRQELQGRYLRDWEDGSDASFAEYQELEKHLNQTEDLAILPLARRLADPLPLPRGPRSPEQRIAGWLAGPGPHGLTVGAGQGVVRGWLNTDLTPPDPRLVPLDLLKPFPFPDNSLDYLFGEHVIEHFTYADGQTVLAECRRVLKPGGRIRLATPDLTRFLQLVSGPRDAVAESYVAWASRGRPRAHPTFALNTIFYSYGHRFIYDPDLFGHALREAGFTDVTFHRPGHSADGHLRGLESHGRLMGNEAFNDLETMVAEAVKP